MTNDEYIAEVEAKREALRLRLALIMASDIPQRVKTARINAVTREAVALKEEIKAAIAREQGTGL